jgi:hypothetical protein
MTNHTPAHQFRHLIDGGRSVPGDEERPSLVAHTGTLIRAIPPQLSFEHGAGVSGEPVQLQYRLPFVLRDIRAALIGR